MKIRLGFVANSSSSCWILTFPKKKIEKGKPMRKVIKSIILNADQKILQDNKDLLTGTNFENLCDQFINSLHSLINPKTRRYTERDGEPDKNIFFYLIGFRTERYGGKEKDWLQYTKIFNKIQKENLQGYYFFAGQCARELDIWEGTFLEEIFDKYVKSNNIQGRYNIILLNFRP